MKALYVASTHDFGGKTSLIVSLGKQLQRNGHTVGYIKPLSTRLHDLDGQAIDRDAVFMQQELGLQDALADIIPIALTPAQIQDVIEHARLKAFESQFEAAYQRMSQGKDVMLVEGGRHPLEGTLFDLASRQIADRINASVLVMVKYEDSLSIDAAMGSRSVYGDRLIGVVLNAVPRMYMSFVQETARPFLEASGLPVLAVMPQERVLLAVSVQELAAHLDGQVVCCPGATGVLVEYLMVGAMTASSAITYFRKRPNKAVITGGDRHDVQLAALETSTRCLILTGGQPPSDGVINRAKEVNVPIVVVEDDTLATVLAAERILGKTSLHEPRKSARFGNILQERFDFERFYGMMGF